MKSPEYAMGLACGIIAALVIFIIVWKFNKKNMKGQFDERQEFVRGRGYKYATFTMLVLMVIDLLLEGMGIFEKIVITRELAILFIIVTGILVYALYCIMNDSYFGVGNDTRTYRAVMWAVIVCNLMSGISGLRDGAFTADGKLSFGPVASLIFVVMFAAVMIALYVRKQSSAAEESEEDDI